MRILRIALFFVNAVIAIISTVVVYRSYDYMGWLAFSICVSIAAISIVNALYVLADTMFDRPTIKKYGSEPTATEQQQAIDEGTPL
jgi:hypothetical protein